MKQTEKNALLIRLGFEFDKSIDCSSYDLAQTIAKLSRLAKKHHKFCEMDCNGRGWINGKLITTALSFGETGAQGKRPAVSAYCTEANEKTVFYAGIYGTQGKILSLCQSYGLTAKFQGDPRGCTVRIYYNDLELTDLL